ncbi:hypothetical protein [Vibrio aestuarianus]|uniref:hypothetical protein n=1 Tax=Vibrio aestuarianus TaxID=28171 RepID=UPI00237D2EF2|nr:hypothetical protein [Vibrio aestuarianus]MDE1264053.1 hypothetical protein [Vibrio aestuarianus]MDE1296178.1 hypothetical protein [Vibrio aestuarianus]
MKPKDATKLEVGFSYGKSIPVGKKKTAGIRTGSDGETVTNSASIKIGRSGLEFTRDEKTNEMKVKATYGVGVGGKHLGAGGHGYIDSSGHVGIAGEANLGAASVSINYDVGVKQVNENSQINSIHDFIDKTNTQINGNPLHGF